MENPNKENINKEEVQLELPACNLSEEEIVESLKESPLFENFMKELSEKEKKEFLEKEIERLKKHGNGKK